jgi:FAD:protein FMN transferase
MRLSLNRRAWAALAVGVCLGCGAPAAPARIERRLGSMGTWLELSVEAPTRAEALNASERAVQAVEATERRLSTWFDGSELARLNRTPVGTPFELSPELASELATVRRWWSATDGAFDPAVGGLIEAWDLRGKGRVPSDLELCAAWPAGGLASLQLEERRAVRKDAALRLEEGGFGKGSGLDAALRALADAGATRAWVDLGGQVAVLGAEDQPLEWGIAHPQRRDEIALSVPLARGSLATSGNSERAIEVGGERYGHLLDPRTGRPARDFGSVTVHAPDAITADCLSTGLYVLGPEAALAFGRTQPQIDVLVLEPAPGGRLRARATGELGRTLELVSDAVDLERLPNTDSELRTAQRGAEQNLLVSSRP